MLLLSLCLPPSVHGQEKAPRELFSEGHGLFSQGKLSEAEALLVRTVDGKFLLEDYSLYFLSLIAFERNDLGRARGYLAKLEERFPRSVWASHAPLLLAKILHAEGKHGEARDQLRSIIEQKKAKKEIRDEARYLLAQIHLTLRETGRAYSTLQELRRGSPLSPLAARARAEVKRLREEHPDLLPLGDPGALAEEAELLVQERQYDEAAKLYRRAVDLVSEENLRSRFLLELAKALNRARKRDEAIPVLRRVLADYAGSPEAPEALFLLGRILWNRDENIEALDHFRQLKMRYPANPLLDSAELASAKIYERLGREQEAIRIYREFPRQFPSSTLREEALWRLGWLHYLRQDYQQAFTAFERVVTDRTANRYKTSALYWQARCAERLGWLARAEEIFLRILDAPEDSYYKGRAAEWLKKSGAAFEERKKPSPPSRAEPPLTSDVAFHLSRARELREIQLNELALTELDAIRERDNSEGVRFILMREYAQAQAFQRSLALAAEVPYDSDELGRYRYPLAFWELVRKAAADRGLDPYLVAALIRQESLFDPKAVSSASALGLMQLLPSTAARVAARLGLRPPQPEKLFEPELNIALGTAYLKELLERYSNNVVKALAAYNAGENALARWEREIAAQEIEEFVERIPFWETRSYILLVLRNHRIYRQIYEGKKE